jgi:hypothetical protein
VQGTDALRRGTWKWTALVVAIGVALVAAAPASAQVVEGQQADPAGDQMITAPGAASALDLSGAAVRYDSSAGEVRITYRGAIRVAAHSRTTYDGVISQTSSPSGCAVVARGDVTFSGDTFDSSGGGDPRGTALLDVKDIGPLDGAVLLPSDGSVVFVFSSPLLQNLDFRCASALHAHWLDANPSLASADEVAPFNLAAVTGPEVGTAATGGAGSTSAADSAVATGGPAPAPGRSLRTAIVVVGGLTARVGPAHGGLRGLLGRGLAIPVDCSARCGVRGRMVSAGAVVARGSVVRLRGGRAVLRLRVDRSARWSLVHRASAPVTIAVTVSGDGMARTSVHPLLLR